MAMLLRRRGHTWPEVDECTFTHFTIEMMVIHDPDYAPQQAGSGNTVVGADEDFDPASFFN